MTEWKEYKLGELCKVRRGASPRPIHDYLSSTGMPWVKISDATSETSRYIKFTAQKILLSGVTKSLKVKPGDFILSNSATPGIPKFMNIEACIHDGWLLLSEFNNINSLFLYYLLLHDRPKLANKGNGSVFTNLKTEIVLNHKIKIPDLETQASIAKILSSFDDKIELNNKINQELESLAQLLFKRWFVDFEFPNEKGEPYKSSGGEMVDSELGEIPKGWEKGALSKIAMLDKSNVKPFEFPDKEFYHFSLPDYDNGKKPSLSIGSDILSSKYKVSPNSVLVSKLNPRIPRVWVITDCEDNCICSTEFQVIKPKSLHYFTFLCNLCSSEKFFDSLRSKVTGTSSSHQRVNPNDIINYSMPLPAIEIVQKFSTAFDENFKIINKNVQENYRLSQLRDTLLPKLISGELQINEN